ncbi:Tritrans polycis-undecaprenyl-diphosphate synthase, partial [Bienertia sinuspersici]
MTELAGRHEREELVEERLDRALANERWRELFPQENVDGFEELLRDAWEAGKIGGNCEWADGVHTLGEKLKRWDGVEFREDDRKLKSLNKRVEALQRKEQSLLVIEETREVEKELGVLRRRKETMAWDEIDISELEVITPRLTQGMKERLEVSRWPGLGKLMSPRILLNQDVKVVEFIDPINRIWRTDLLREILLPMDVERIQNIPLWSTIQTDERYWNASKDGIFRVKDSYHVATEEINDDSSSIGFDPEDLLHALHDCNAMSEAWEGQHLTWRHTSIDSFREWLAWAMVTLDKEKQEVPAILTWRIWKARNEWIFKHVKPCPKLYYSSAVDTRRAYQQVCTNPNPKAPNQKAWWSAPGVGLIKVNFDVALDRKLGKVGIGIMARNEEGEILITKATFLHQDWDPELCAAQVVIQALEGKQSRTGYVESYVRGARILAAKFEEISFTFCFRECNEIAHTLARWAVSNYCDEVWLNDVPTWIEDLVIAGG